MTIYDITPVVAEATNTEIFSCAEFGEIRTVVFSGEPFVMLKDVCDVLEIGNPSQAKTRLNKKGVITNEVLTKGGIQKADFINESNLYKLIFQSRKPQAERFSEWVTSEVLPSIRKHGMYATEELLDNPDLLIQAATKLKEEREKNKRLEQEKENLSNVIAGVAPTVEFAETILESNGTLTATQIGADYGISAIELNSILHEKGIQYKNNGQWILYAKYKDKGYVESKTFYIGNGDTRTRTVWTQKGRKFIHEILTEMGYKNKQLEMEV